MMLSESAALAGRAGVQAIPRAGTWEGNWEFLALARYRQDPDGCRGALRVGAGCSGHRERSSSLPAPGLALTRSPGGGGRDAQQEDRACPHLQKRLPKTSAPPGTGSGGLGSISHRVTRELRWSGDLKLKMMWWGMLGKETTRVSMCLACSPFHF